MILAALQEAVVQGREARSTGLALAARFPELEGIALLLRGQAEEVASFEKPEEVDEVLETAADFRLKAAFEAVFPPEETVSPEDAGNADWARYFVKLARRDEGRSLRQRIETLAAVRNPELEDGRRTKVLGAALEIQTPWPTRGKPAGLSPRPSGGIWRRGCYIFGRAGCPRISTPRRPRTECSAACNSRSSS